MSQEEMENIKNLGGLLSHMNVSIKDQGIKDERITTEMYEKTQLLDLLIFMLVTLGLALCTLGYNLEFINDYGYFCFSVLFLNLGFTVVCGLFVVMRENLQLAMDKNRGRADQDDNLTTTGRIKIVIFECALLMIIPSPFFIGIKNIYYNHEINQDIYYHLNDFLYLFSLLRFIYFSKSFANLTVWKTRSASRVCKMYGCQPGLYFAIKCMMKDTPSQFNLLLVALDLFFFTLALRISEAPISRVIPSHNMFNYANCLWLVSMTTTTAGYGDVYPKTPLGKMSMFLCSMTGVIIVSLIIVTVTNML
jgi:Ion channel